MKKLSEIDIFIILFVVLTLVGVGARLGVGAYLNSKNNGDYEITIKITDVYDSKKNAIQEGDTVYIEESGNVFGTIQTVAFTDITPANGEVKGEGESKCDAIVIIDVRGKESKDGFILESEGYLYLGTTVNVTSEGYSGEVLIMDIVNKNE